MGVDLPRVQERNLDEGLHHVGLELEREEEAQAQNAAKATCLGALQMFAVRLKKQADMLCRCPVGDR